MTEIVLMRHGVTSWNQRGLLQGHSDVALSDEGRRQARLLALRMAREDRPAALYSSDLRRARETADIVAEACGLDVIPTRALREHHYGVFEGVSWEAYRDEIVRASELRGIGPSEYRPEGGESRRDFARRIEDFLAGILESHRGGVIWIVCHGGVIRYIVEWLVRPDEDPFPSSNRVANVGVTRLRREGGGWHIAELNSVEHLEPSS